MSYRGPKGKLSRRLGLPLTERCVKVLRNKPYPPGDHWNQKRPFRMSEYGKRLLEKQRLRFQYNVSEKQLRNYFAKARRRKGNTSEVLLGMLEGWLDNLVYRAGFAPSIYAARQLVVHGHIQVNGRRVDRPAFAVQVNDQLSVREKSKKVALIKDSLQVSDPPAYVTTDKQAMSARMTRIPERDEIPVACDLLMVVEFYSR